MKMISALTLAVSLTTSTAFAGGVAPVLVEEPPQVIEKPASSVSPLLILGLIVLIGIAVSQNDDNEDPPTEEPPVEEQPANQ